MKIILLCILLQVCTPQYEFKSTSSYLQDTQEHLEQQDNSSNRPGPKRVSGIDGWAWWILWGAQNGVPSSASNEELFSYFDYMQAGGTLSYTDWINSQSVPLGSPLCLILIAGTYILAKKLRKSETQ